MRYWEDFPVGDWVVHGEHEITADEIVQFGRAFDPQPFHTDPDVEGPYGGLIASGWHSASVYMGMFVRNVLLDSASLGSPGVEELRWLKPVRPGDGLHARVTVVSTRASKSKPDRGIVETRIDAFNQREEHVATLRAVNFIKRRPSK
jgi:acyl dehydratase